MVQIFEAFESLITAIILLSISKEPNRKLGLNLEFLGLLLEFLTGKWQLGGS